MVCLTNKAKKMQETFSFASWICKYKTTFQLIRKLWEMSMNSYVLDNFEDKLNFPIFMLHLMKNWLGGYAMVNNHFLLMLKIFNVLNGQGMTQISIVHTNNLWESTIFFCWYQKRWICYKRKNIVRHLT